MIIVESFLFFASKFIFSLGKVLIYDVDVFSIFLLKNQI